MTENFLNLEREKATQVQEADRVSNRPTPRHIIIKMPSFKDKERILKESKEKPEVTYKGVPVGLTADFSTDTLQARREWQEIFQVMQNKGLQPRRLYPGRLSIKMEGEIRSFLDKES